MRFLNSIAAFVLLIAALPASGDEADVSVSAAVEAGGIRTHRVMSPYQRGDTTIRVLLPDKLEAGKRYSVVYVLPVEAKDGSRFGDGLAEVKRHDLHNKYRAVFVAPTFSHLPWYADHPTDPKIRQESHFLKVVVPYIDKQYAVRTDAAGRLLLGFSKSGWGAFSLLLRHPDLFGKAAAWDAPMMMGRTENFGAGEIFGAAENFAKYRIMTLLENRAEGLREGKRLILMGYGNFRGQNQQAHGWMDKWKIDHEYRDGPERKHEWSSGWLPEAVELLAPPPPEEGQSKK